MPSEMYFLRQMMSGFAPNYMQFTLLAGMLVAVIFRPERIRRVAMFSTAAVLLAVSLGAGPVTNLLLSLAGGFRGMSGSRNETVLVIISLAEGLGSLLLAVSICLAVFSLLPDAQNPYRNDAAQLPRHPMDG